MKKALLMCLVVGMAMVPFTASAEAPSCESVSSLARDIMRNRQGNVPMAQMMKATEGMDFTQSLIKEAYKLPRYSSEEYRQNAITDFENNWYLACVESKE